MGWAKLIARILWSAGARLTGHKPIRNFDCVSPRFDRNHVSCSISLLCSQAPSDPLPLCFRAPASSVRQSAGRRRRSLVLEGLETRQLLAHEVIVVPFIAHDADIPHIAHEQAPITSKAVVRNATDATDATVGRYRVTWDVDAAVSAESNGNHVVLSSVSENANESNAAAATWSSDISEVSLAAVKLRDSTPNNGEEPSLDYGEASPQPFLYREKHELVLIDSGIPDFAQFLASMHVQSIGTAREVLPLDFQSDGVLSISQILSQRTNLDAVHIFTHGQPGAIQLGTASLNAKTLSDYADSIRGWSESLKEDADILLYGCEVAGNFEGQHLVEQIAALSGADAAASTDETGSADVGGNWVLEFSAGSIETSVALSEQTQTIWKHSLAAPRANSDSFTVGQGSAANVLGVLRNDYDQDTFDTLTITGFTPGTHGSVAVTRNGTRLAYTPDPGYLGADTFSYTISDGRGGTSVGNVTITVASSAAAQPIAVAVVHPETGDYQGSQALINQLNDDTYFNFQAELVYVNNLATRGWLNNYDVVVLGNGSLSQSSPAFKKMSSALRAWSEAGGGVIAAGVALGNYGSTNDANLNAILPVDTEAGPSGYITNTTVLAAPGFPPITAGVGTFTISQGNYVEVTYALDAAAREANKLSSGAPCSGGRWGRAGTIRLARPVLRG